MEAKLVVGKMMILMLMMSESQARSSAGSFHVEAAQEPPQATDVLSC